MSTEWSLPQPFETVDHTADTGVRVQGETPDETLARLALAHASLLSGGESVAEHCERRVDLPGDPDLALVGVDLLRELNRIFCTERLIAARVRVDQLGGERLILAVGFGDYEPDRHREGLDIKAVTFHAARFERDGDDWVAQVVFDI